MTPTARSPKSVRSAGRRARCGAFAGALGAAALVAALGLAGNSATAAPDPCAASEVAKTVGSVATSIGEYLEEHPQTNAALTTISKQQAGPQSVAALKAYLDANPDVGKDLQELQRPLTTLSGRCRLPLTMPQLLGLMQAAQQGGAGAPAGLPGGQPSAQTVGLPGAATPANPAPAGTARPGSATLPTAPIAGLP
ncbi:Heme-binding protein [Mycolicibacterium hassiacum DSM 44199]|jgi:hemophore|uniref:hemophore n=1 Tax=Mycolicibacterium hassiacum TaxID=46351 RepID=UPI000A5C05D6|nr:Heme-binding protein [Mycolicibacterium hassiacum DSM 44199]